MKSKIELPGWTGVVDLMNVVDVTSVESFAILDSTFNPDHLLSDTDASPYGFVYQVYFSDDTTYIGKKNLFSERKVSKGKKELAAMTDKRQSKKKLVVKESDWRTYFGSFKDKKFLEQLKTGQIRVTCRRVIDVAYTKSQLTYLETKYLFDLGVLEPQKTYYRNDNILGKFYRRSLELPKSE